MDEAVTLRLVAGLVSVGGIITSLENLKQWPDLRRWFVQPWQGWRDATNLSDSIVPAIRRRLVYLLCARLALFIGLFLSSLLASAPSGVLAAVLAILILVDSSVRLIGGDGADQMSFLVCLAVACSALPTPYAAKIGLGFLTAQAFLAYVSAGASKLASDDWMRAGVIGKILDTQTYGHEMVAKAFLGSPALDRVLSASVGAMEVAVPVLCLLPYQGTLLAGLAIGLVFHLSCAIFMGLNNFVWAFLATYPAIYYMHRYMYGVA